MSHQVPGRVVVAGGGIVGLSCAWHLLRAGVEVTVLDRSSVGAGASWGNAGWVAPAMAVPLPEPSMLLEGVRGLASPNSPLALDPRISRQTAAFLTGFARNATTRHWESGLLGLNGLNVRSLAAFDEMISEGVELTMHEADVHIGFQQGESDRGLRHEFDAVSAAGQPVSYSLAPPVAPFSSRIASMMVLSGQRYVDPGQIVAALADAVREAGGRIREGSAVRSVGYGPRGLQVDTWASEPHVADAVVLATGAWLPDLARHLGVRIPIQAGRGYSCTVGLREPLKNPLYVPGARVAITPYRGGARVAGTMEIAHRDAPFIPGRLEAIRRSVETLLEGVVWNDVSDPWVGSRPLTPDGLPVIGPTRLAGVHVAGGHGMWGLTLGPVTGKLLAQQIVQGRGVAELAPFDPQRKIVRRGPHVRGGAATTRTARARPQH